MINVLVHDIARDKKDGRVERDRKEWVGTCFQCVSPQSFGVLVSFPLVFAGATAASVLSILVLVHITSASFVVAFGSFLVANATALLLSTWVGPLAEEWSHRQAFRQGPGPGYRPIKDDTKDTASPHCEEERDLELYVAEKLAEPRTAQFYLSLCFVILLANVLGSIIGSYCAHHF